MSILRRLHGDERGSMVLALLAVIVVGGLTTVLTASTVANQRATRFDDNYVSAVHVAELGLHQALFLLDEGLITPGMTRNVTVDGKTAQWTAIQDPANPGGWTITAAGSVNGVTRRVQISAVQRPRFPSAIYTEVNMHLTGPQDDVYFTATDSKPPYFLRSGGALQSSNPSQLPDEPLELANDENLKFITNTLDTCGSLTEWRASQNGGLLNLGGGTHCFSKLIFDTHTRVVADPANPVLVYVDGHVEFTNKPDVIVVATASSTTSTKAAAAFQIYVAGRDPLVGDKVIFSKQHDVTAAIYAPAAECRGNPTMPNVTIYGALVCGTLKTNGTFTIEYDSRISDITSGSPQLQGWTEL